MTDPIYLLSTQLGICKLSFNNTTREKTVPVSSMSRSIFYNLQYLINYDQSPTVNLVYSIKQCYGSKHFDSDSTSLLMPLWFWILLLKFKSSVISYRYLAGAYARFIFVPSEIVFVRRTKNMSM